MEPGGRQRVDENDVNNVISPSVELRKKPSLKDRKDNKEWERGNLGEVISCPFPESTA